SSNGTSEFDTAQQSVPSTTGPVGEPALPPSRPTTSGAVSQEGWSRISSSRASMRSPPSRHTYTSLRSRDGSQDHAQAQQVWKRMETKNRQRTTTRHTIDNSNASVNTAREAEQATRDGASSPPPLPTSRGLSIATKFRGGMEARRRTCKLRCSNDSPSKEQQQRLDPPPKSPRSLRGSLGFGSKHSSKRDIHERRPSGQGHEKLPSLPNSPVVEKAEKSHCLHNHHDDSCSAAAKTMNISQGTCFSSSTVLRIRAPWIWHNITPAIPIVFAYVFFVALSAFVHAAFSDPGILPRNLHPHPPNPEEEKDPLAVGPPTTEWVMVKTFPSSRHQPNLESHGRRW
ncbi:Palmitoyltransferase erf2, partial [Pseudocercospora fuligena]